MAVLGLGTDIVQIDRLEAQLARSDKLARRVLTDEEFEQFSANNYTIRLICTKKERFYLIIKLT